MSESKLELDKVSIALNGKQLLTVDSSVGPGEVLTIMGPSGSGKSSLLAYIAGFLAPVFEASGGVFVNGDDITPPSCRASSSRLTVSGPSPISPSIDRRKFALRYR